MDGIETLGVDELPCVGKVGTVTGDVDYAVVVTGFDGIEMVGVDDPPPEGTVGTVGTDGTFGTVGVVVTSGLDSGRFRGNDGAIGATSGAAKSIVTGKVNFGTVYSLLVVFYAANRFFQMPSPTVYLTSFSS